LPDLGKFRRLVSGTRRRPASQPARHGAIGLLTLISRHGARCAAAPSIHRVRTVLARLARGGLFLLAGALLLAPALPLLRVNWWCVRIFDSPRPQAAALLAAALLGLAWLARTRRAARFLAVAVAVALVAQLHHIWPYTPLHPVQAAAAAATGCPAEHRLSVLVANLKVNNRVADRFLAAVRRTNPDLVLVLELDPRWARALCPLHDTYPERLMAPRDSPWGLALYARLPLVDPELRTLLSD
jgi:endonuclease/exonuclease/phosphatase (EEP) superfamily protein YafD